MVVVVVEVDASEGEGAHQNNPYPPFPSTPSRTVGRPLPCLPLYVGGEKKERNENTQRGTRNEAEKVQTGGRERPL